MIRTILITAAVSAISGAAGVWFLRPPRVDTSTEYVDRVRTVVVTKYVTRTKTRTVTKPDGTVIIERTETESKTDSKNNTRTVTAPAPKWAAGALVGITPGVRGSEFGGIQVSRHLAGPVWVGASATVPLRQPLTMPTLGVSLGVTF